MVRRRSLLLASALLAAGVVLGSVVVRRTAPPSVTLTRRPLTVDADLRTSVAEGRFTMAGLAWEGPAPDGVWYRVGDDDGWGPWRALPFDPDHAPDPGSAEALGARLATEPVFTGPGERIQFRFDAAAPPGRVEAALIDVRRPGPLVRLAARLPALLSPAVAAVDAPAIRPRSDWDPAGECPPRREPEEVQVSLAIVHHTGFTAQYQPEDVPGIILAYCRYHRDVRGWDDMAYNVLIDRFGTVWEGRAGGVERGIRGAHTKGFSAYSTGIALIGNFTSATPSAAQQQALVDVLAWKSSLHNLDPTGTATVVSQGSRLFDAGTTVTLPVIAGHRDAQSTACPGTILYGLLPDIRQATAARWTPIPYDRFTTPVAGDLTGDGVEDGAVHRPDTGAWTVTDGATGATSTWYAGSAGEAFHDAVAADLDGDGVASIVARRGTTVEVLDAAAGTLTARAPLTLPAASWSSALVGDLDGDGTDDVLFVAGAATRALLADVLVDRGSVDPSATRLALADVDGDGRDDLVGLRDDGTLTVAVAAAGGFAAPAVRASLPGGPWGFLVAGDFDGDGRDDVAAFSSNDATWWWVRSTAEGPVVAGSLATPSPAGWTAAFTVDVGGDGTDEVLALDAYAGGWHLVRFDGPVPFATRVEDAPFRTTMTRPRSAEPPAEAFLTWFAQELTWIRTDLGDGATRTDVDAAERIAGDDRYATAAAAALRGFPAGAATVLLATGADHPDALAGGPVAALLDAPVLLTAPDRLPGATRDALVRLGPSRVVVLGAEGAVAPEVLVALGDLVPLVDRVGGPDRYATAVELSRAFFPAATPTVYLATGGDFPDALAGAAAAARDRAPILLVPSSTLPGPVRRELVRLAPERIVVLGGEGVVSAATVAEAAALTGADVVRLAGTDRYATADAVAEATFPDGSRFVVVATGEDFPDALAGAALAARLDAPLLLVRSGDVPPSTWRRLDALDPELVMVLGGTAVVPEAVRHALEDRGPAAATVRLAAVGR